MFGMHCDFTHGVLAACAAAGVEPVALLIPGPPGIESPIERTMPRVVLPAAGQSLSTPGVRTFLVGHPGADHTMQLIVSLEPEIIAVACYPDRIPMNAVNLARRGGLNVHPSLLPAGRGPDPLFWTFRRGDGTAAVTVHALVREFDAGPIYDQRLVAYRPGVRESELDKTLARVGGAMLGETIWKMTDGTYRAQPQDNSNATYEPSPSAADYSISSTEPVQRAFTFIRGIAERGVPISIVTPHGTETVSDALAYDSRTDATRDVTDDEVWIEFVDGQMLAVR